MKLVDYRGLWEITIPHLKQYESYKYHFKNARGEYVDKADPFAFFSELRPGSCSRLFDIRNFIWHDDKYLKIEQEDMMNQFQYEIHLGSWKGKVDGRNISYEEVADYLIPYVKNMGSPMLK